MERDSDQAVMYGEHIWLRPVELRDALALSQATREDGPPLSEAAWRNWMQNLPENHLAWAICASEGQIALGTAELRRIDRWHQVGELQIQLWDGAGDESAGLMESIRLLLDYAFDSLNLHTVRTLNDSRQRQRGRVLEKCGFNHVGSLTSEIPLGLGRYAASDVYQVVSAS